MMNYNILHKKLKLRLEQQNKDWKFFIYAQKEGFYQGFEKIGIKGARPTEERLKRYDIQKYLSKEKDALDIGSNCGFFSIYLSEFLKSVEGVELNPFLVNIGEDTVNFLGVNNVVFNNSSFEDFITDKKYDLIFSLANDSTIDNCTKFEFHEYINKIIMLLKKEGILIFESHAIDVYKEELFIPKLKLIKRKFKILDDKLVQSNYPYNIKERRVLILKL